MSSRYAELKSGEKGADTRKSPFGLGSVLLLFVVRHRVALRSNGTSIVLVTCRMGFDDVDVPLSPDFT